MTTQAAIGCCSENDFPKSEHSSIVPVKEFSFQQSFKSAVFKGNSFKYIKRNVITF